MRTVSSIRHENLIRLANQYGRKDLSLMLGHASQSTVSQLINKSKDSATGKEKNVGDKLARHIEKSLSLPSGWMDTPATQHPDEKIVQSVKTVSLCIQDSNTGSDFTGEGNPDGGRETYEAHKIYYAQLTSCTSASKGFLIKEKSFFAQHGLAPENALAVIAQDESMADYISQGDAVIFDKSKTIAQSGRIFLIDHPDGLRIRQLRREIDATWILESRNGDKRRYFDERIEKDKTQFLRILGQFVHRQGG